MRGAWWSARTAAGLVAFATGTAGLLSSQSDSTRASPPTLHYVVPDDPAFTFLGGTPAKVARAGVPADFAVALLSAVDSAGRLRDGFALGATLWSVIPRLTIPLSSYQHSRLAYALANTQVAVGAVRTSGDSAATDAAFGLRTTIFDRADPMRDAAFVGAFTAALTACLPSRPGTPLGGPGPVAPPAAPALDAARTRLDSLEAMVRYLSGRLATLSARFDTAFNTTAVACAAAASDSLRKAWLPRHWNGVNLTIGFATGWRFPESSLRDRRALGWSGWVAGSLPWGVHSQVVATARFDHRNGAGAVASSNVLAYGARLFQGSESSDFFLELLEERRLGGGASTPHTTSRWTAGAEVRVSPEVWLSMGFGAGFANAKRVVIGATTRWGMVSGERSSQLR